MKKLPIIFLLFIQFSSAGQDISALWQRYTNGEKEYALTQALALEQKQPKNPELKVMLGRMYGDANNWDKAMPYLLQVSANKEAKSYQKAWSLAYLGIGYFQKGEYEKAKQSLTECLQLNATKNVNDFAARRMALFGFDEVYKGFTTKETTHIIFHFHPGALTQIKDMEAYMQRREQAFVKINDFFKSTLPKKTDFFVWDSSESGKKVFGRPLGFSVPEVCVSHAAVGQTPGHEITHIITNYTAENTRRNVLINEGTSVFFDQNSRNRLETAREALAKQRVPAVQIKQIWNNREVLNEVVLYAVGGAFVEYLIQNGGREKFLQLIKNQTYENALAIYGPDLEKMITAFEQQLTQNNQVAKMNFAGNKIEPGDIPKLTEAVILAVIQDKDPNDNYYRVLILMDGKPVTKIEADRISKTKKITSLKVIKDKAEIKKYTGVDLNGIILMKTN